MDPKKPDTPSSTPEAERLRVLRFYEVMDTPSEPAFDELCSLASSICRKPIAFISLVNEFRSWLKAKHGWAVNEMPRDISFCAHAILQPDLLIVKDALADKRFSNNPLVLSDPAIRFYAGAPLITTDGHAIGALAVLDTKPGDLTEEQRSTLLMLARQVMAHLESRRALVDLAHSKRQLEKMDRTVRDSEKQVFRFLEAIPVGIFVIDQEGSPYYANQAAKMILGRGIAPGALAEDLSEVYKAFIAGTQQEYPPEKTPIVRALSGESTMIDNLEIHREDEVIPIQIWGTPIYDDDEKIAYALVAFIDITRHRWAERRLTVQYSTTQILAESKSLEEVIPRILQSICQSVEWEYGAFWVVDNNLQVLKLVDLWHSPEKDVSDFVSLTRRFDFPRGLGVPGRVWESAKPAWIPNVVEDPNFPRTPAALKSGLHAAFAFPVMLRDQVIAVFEFFSRNIQQPDEELLSMLGSLGSQVGQFILHKETERQLVNQQKP